MKATQIEYSRTFNLGNYESETIKIQVTIYDDEDTTAEQAIKFARMEVGKGSYRAEQLRKQKEGQKEGQKEVQR